MIDLRLSDVEKTPAEYLGALTADRGQVGLLLAEKARFERDLQMAAEIQRALLPAPTHSGPSFDLAAASTACRAVGGDFFDYLELPGRSFGFALGDVAGKGPAAALLTAVAQSIFAAHAPLLDGPAKTMERINQGLLRHAIEGRFTTMFYGVLAHDGHLSYCNAGHEPALLVGRNGVQLLEKGGVVLGLFEHAAYETCALLLAPGDVVVVYSDGFTEARNPMDEEFGRERLVACVSTGRGVEPQAVLERLSRSLHVFTAGSPQVDDLSAIVVRYRGPSTSE